MSETFWDDVFKVAAIVTIADILISITIAIAA